MDTSTYANIPKEACSGAAENAGRLTAVLEPGEKILWVGQPRPFRVMRSKTAHAVFGTAVPILFLVTPLRSLLISLLQPFASDQNIVLPVIGGVFLMIAIYGLLVPLVAYRRSDDDTGDILFSSRPAYDQDISLRPLRGFFGVPEAEHVHRTISEAQDVRMRERQHAVHDYIELLLQGKRPEDLSFR